MRTLRIFAAAGTVLVLTACPGNDEPDPYVDGAPATVEDEPLDRMSMRFQLQPVGPEGAPGSATLTALTREETEVSMALEGAPASENIPAHVHRGSCAEGGPVEWPLGQVAVDPDSAALHTHTVPAWIDDLVEDGYFVQVHGPEGDPISCATLTADAAEEIDRETLREEAPPAVERGAGDGGEGEELES